MKKLSIFACMLLATFTTIIACAPSDKQEKTKTNMMNKEKKVLVAYFSWSGNTQVAAQYIANKLNADTFKIERVTPYPEEYGPCTEDAKAEKDRDIHPEIRGSVDNMANYDVVFVGVPVWWYTAPMPAFTFLEKYDLKGKIVVPFCTCYTAEYETLNDIVKATPASRHLKGLTIVTTEMGGKGMNAKRIQIDNWLNEIGF